MLKPAAAVVALAAVLAAAALPAAAAGQVGAAESQFTPDEIVFGVCCILTGLYLCFAGYRILRVLVFLTGFYVGYWTCYAIMTGIDADYGPNEDWVVFGSSVGAGILVGLLLVCLLQLGIFLLGALAGFMLAMWILSIVDPGSPLLTNDAYKWLFICGLALVVGILALIYQKVVIILGSSYVGAYVLFYGIDTFAQTGFYKAVRGVIGGNDDYQQCNTTECVLMLAGCIVTAVIGVIVQFYTNRDRDHNKPNSNVYVKIN